MSKQLGADSRAALRYPNFRRYVSARFLVTASSEMQSVAVGWQLYSMTHRPLDLGLVGLAQFFPGICLFPLAGQAADRIARNRILRACYIGFSVASLLLLAFTLGHVQTPWPLYLALLWNGTVRAFNAPASQAILPLLVEQKHFANAVAWGSSSFQTATIAGPLLGGGLYAITGHPGAVYGLAAVAYGVAFFLLGRIQFKTAPRIASSSSGHMVFEGLRYIWRQKLVLERFRWICSQSYWEAQWHCCRCMHGKFCTRARLAWDCCAAHPAWARC